MKGADEYCKVFSKGEQFGKLYVLPGSHARGATFRIYVLASDRSIGEQAPYAVHESVQVYGITGGQPGWTETYGWLHKGQWVDDFIAVYEQRKAENERKWKAANDKQNQKDVDAQDHTASLLADY